ncbi:hypothetical protein T484DRAFT_1976472 [Baffinella frigidus]|nr:hypothetical protein T484DRAFT_1976472 [Cryptophyta sp. CCMP2293]
MVASTRLGALFLAALSLAVGATALTSNETCGASHWGCAGRTAATVPPVLPWMLSSSDEVLLGQLEREYAGQQKLAAFPSFVPDASSAGAPADLSPPAWASAQGAIKGVVSAGSLGSSFSTGSLGDLDLF